VLDDAVRRGVRVIVFVRDPYDAGPKKQAELVRQLRAVVPRVVPVNVMHQKIVVIDEHTVLLGSLNTLSQSRSREVMLTIRGATSHGRSSPTRTPGPSRSRPAAGPARGQWSAVQGPKQWRVPGEGTLVELAEKLWQRILTEGGPEEEVSS
jgi:phosphatidylserine/phosphatidylglycerophosphate/cardiolipin synthase-like enzyme